MSRLKDTDILGEVYNPITKEIRENVRLSEVREFILGVKDNSEKNPKSKKETKPKVDKKKDEK